MYGGYEVYALKIGQLTISSKEVINYKKSVFEPLKRLYGYKIAIKTKGRKRYGISGG
jgi:hypothetical protein